MLTNARHGARLVSTGFTDYLDAPEHRGHAAAIARHMKWTPNTVTAIKHRRRRVRPEDARKIARLLEMDVTTLFEETHRAI